MKLYVYEYACLHVCVAFCMHEGVYVIWNLKSETLESEMLVLLKIKRDSILHLQKKRCFSSSLVKSLPIERLFCSLHAAKRDNVLQLAGQIRLQPTNGTRAHYFEHSRVSCHVQRYYILQKFCEMIYCTIEEDSDMEVGSLSSTKKTTKKSK